MKQSACAGDPDLDGGVTDSGHNQRVIHVPAHHGHSKTVFTLGGILWRHFCTVAEIQTGIRISLFSDTTASL